MMERSRAKELTDSFGKYSVAVVGDLMLDRYVWGTATRISYEAPVPVVRVRRRRSALGGAANVLRNLAAFNIKPLAFGVVGEDAYGDEFCQLCDKWDISTEDVLRLKDRQTTAKTRVIAENQQVTRIDDECCDPISDEIAEQILAALHKKVEAGGIDAIILEDYNKGVLNDRLAGAVQGLAKSHGIPCTLDPHPANTLDVKGLTLMTPNRPESFGMAGEYFRDTVFPICDDEPLQTVARKICEGWEPDHLLITLGAGGLALFDADGTCHHIPTVAQEVFDVSGAGDTVISACTAALIAGASAREACELANHAAGVVVGKVGTVPVEVDELLASFDA